MELGDLSGIKELRHIINIIIQISAIDCQEAVYFQVVLIVFGLECLSSTRVTPSLLNFCLIASAYWYLPCFLALSLSANSLDISL